MPPLLAGAKIRGADFPASQYAADTTTISGIVSTTPAAGSPEVSVTFIAPTSGSVLLSVGLSARCATGGNRTFLAPEVRLTNVAGAVVVAASSVAPRGVSCPGEPSVFPYRTRTTLLTGLTPGQQYFARTMHWASAASPAVDLQVRDITVTPTPLGGNRAGTPINALDFSPAVFAQNTTQIDNPVNTAYASAAPEVSVTFVAPTSGRALLVVGGGAGNSAAGNRIFLAPEVRVGTVAGDVVLSPSVTLRGWSSDRSAAAFNYGSRESLLEGLIPGTTYFARVMHAVSADGGTNTQDMAARDIAVVPCS
ncbi:hypothetical protein [Nonomuraea soli]|uniref:Uncharacterized protein n=1 Tax=Nonomuraea soli TaxID=1032476 RepID=A0A7W0HVP9_9ACTN|nr:hypothetical protein [Nonomuraea soli]MBA2897400.1 hypothetical protein [Nonomuraea soli]